MQNIYNKFQGYLEGKYDEINKAIQRNFEVGANVTIREDENTEEVQNYREMIDQLKGKMKDASTIDKYLLLSVLPKSWTPNRVQNEFGVSYHLAQSVKKLVAECGILQKPKPRSGKKLNEVTSNLIDQFYNSDQISRVQPGIRDCVTVRVGDQRTTVT